MPRSLALVATVVFGLLFVPPGLVHGESGDKWTDYIAYVGFESSHHPEDYLRNSPPYGRHVRVRFEYESKFEKEIHGMEVSVLFIDPFGDALHERTMTKTFILSPGERVESSWSIEEPLIPLASAYSALSGPANNGTLRAKISVERMAFADGSIVRFDGSPVWKLPSRTRESEGTTAVMAGARADLSQDADATELLALIELLVNRVDRLEDELQLHNTAIQVMQRQLDHLVGKAFELD